MRGSRVLAAGSGHCGGISTSSAVKESYFKALQVFSLLNQQFLHPSQTRGLVVKSIPLPLSLSSGRALEQWQCPGEGAPGQTTPVLQGSSEGPASAQSCPEGSRRLRAPRCPNPKSICPSGCFWEHTGAYMSS